MAQTGIPFLFMRGGTSRGPYLRRDQPPDDMDRLAAVPVAMLGSGHPINIDGIGGGTAVTTKVAMLSSSEDEWADVDYFFCASLRRGSLGSGASFPVQDLEFRRGSPLETGHATKGACASR